MAHSSFTLSSYHAILETALNNGYQFLGFNQIGQEHSSYSCLLRHDVDSELWSCSAMADIEEELGISATYFLMLRSTSYNLFCIESREIIERLLKGGHHIGLHFMVELCEHDTIELLSEKVLAEVKMINHEIGVNIHAVSFHHPSEVILNNNILIGSLINTYNKIQMGDYFYVSDSNMVWRHQRPGEIFAHYVYPRIQLLIHPMWWTSEPMTLKEKWRNVLNYNRKAVIEHWSKRERTLKDISIE